MLNLLVLFLTSLYGSLLYGNTDEKGHDLLNKTLPGVKSILENSGNPSLNKDLQAQLIAMEVDDQTARLKLSKEKNPTVEEWEEVAAVDKKHNKLLKEIISEFGWPGIRLVGLKGASAMWLLVQHQDLDPLFQKKCLNLLKSAVQTQEASYRDYAYLLDRVRMNENELQVYGTQWIQKDGKFELYPVEDPDNLDQRRSEAGLCSLEDYKKELKAVCHLSDSDF